MNKTLKLVLCLVLVLSSVLCFAACSDDKDEKKSDTPTNAPVVTPPVADTPVVDTPVVDTPVVDTPVVDTPVTSSIAGTYTLYAMEQNGELISGEDLALVLEAMGVTDPNAFMSIVMNADGTAVMTVMGEVAEMGYADGEMWPAEDPSDKAPYTFENGQLTIGMDGTYMVFAKN